MKYCKLHLLIIRYKVAIAKVRCARYVASTMLWMLEHHIISSHTAVRISRNAYIYAQRVVEKMSW